MRNQLRNILMDILGAVFGGFSLLGVLIDIILLGALYPTIKTALANAQTNMSAGEVAVSAIIPMLIVFALCFAIGKQTGLIKGNSNF